MKTRTSLNLHIEYDNGKEQLVRQGFGAYNQFELHERDMTVHPYWERKYGKPKQTHQWANFIAEQELFSNRHSQPIFSSNDNTLFVDSVDAQSGTITINPGSITPRRGHTVTSDRLTSAAALRQTQRDAMVSSIAFDDYGSFDSVPSHMDHVSSRIGMIQAQRQINIQNEEMLRRVQQSQADTRRREEERLRERRPWERVRNFFGRD